MRCCPECNYISDATAGLNCEDEPNVGDISICFKCGAITEFDEDLQLIEMSDEKLSQIKKESPEDYQMLIDAVIMIKAKSYR